MILRFPTVTVDTRRRILVRDGEDQSLGTLEAELLAYLASRAGETIPYADLLRDVWEFHPDHPRGVVQTAMSRLRGLVGDDPRAPRYVFTVRGRGYRFELPPEPSVSSPSSDEDIWWGEPDDAFVGRASELAELARAVGSGRLVTVGGQPGVGRRRLVARCLQQHVGDPVAPIELSGRDLPEVVACAARQLDVRVGGRRCSDAVARLRDVLRNSVPVAVVRGPAEPALRLLESLRSGRSAVAIVGSPRARAADHLQLSPLNEDEATALMTTRLAEHERTPVPPDVAARLRSLADGLPGRLELVAGFAAAVGLDAAARHAQGSSLASWLEAVCLPAEWSALTGRSGLDGEVRARLRRRGALTRGPVGWRVASWVVDLLDVQGQEEPVVPSPSELARWAPAELQERAIGERLAQGTRGDLLQLRARLHAAAGRPSAAREDLVRAAELASGEGDQQGARASRVALAATWLQQGRPEQALVVLDALLPDLTDADSGIEARIWKGAALARVGRLVDAEVCLRRALETPTATSGLRAASLLQLADVLAARRRVSEARGCLREVLRTSPRIALTAVLAVLDLGMLAAAEGRLDRAESALSTGIEAARRLADARAEALGRAALGLVHLECGRHEAARAELRAARHPDARARAELGLALLRGPGAPVAALLDAATSTGSRAALGMAHGFAAMLGAPSDRHLDLARDLLGQVDDPMAPVFVDVFQGCERARRISVGGDPVDPTEVSQMLRLAEALRHR